MSSKSQKRKNKKKYYSSCKKPKCSGLDPGMRGFLVTCNEERLCVKETYNLLNEFADEIYGPEFIETDCKSANSYVDIEEEFSKELAAMKSTSQRRFQQVSTKVKGILFIRTTIPDPVLLANNIFETVLKTGKRRTRFILKLKPVVMTCKSYETDIRRALDDILSEYPEEARGRDLKYKVETKIRHNDKITSSHVIWYVRESVDSVVPKWTACILEPDLIIDFCIFRTVCCISILDKYEEFKKYNLSSVATLAEGKAQQKPCGDENQYTVGMAPECENNSNAEPANQNRIDRSEEAQKPCVREDENQFAVGMAPECVNNSNFKPANENQPANSSHISSEQITNL